MMCRAATVEPPITIGASFSSSSNKDRNQSMLALPELACTRSKSSLRTSGIVSHCSVEKKLARARFAYSHMSWFSARRSLDLEIP
jgi:hypothetical protein